MPAPDRFVFDLHSPYPNVVIDTIRLAVLGALADLVDHIERLGDSFLLGQTAADFAQTVLTNFGVLQQTVTAQESEIETLRSDLDALAARVVALEAPPEAPA